MPAYPEPVRASMVDYSITFQAADICASCGKYSQPVNTLLHHTELKVFGNVCYIAFGSLSFAIDTCVLVNCFKPEKQEKKCMQVLVLRLRQRNRKNIILGVNVQGFQQLEKTLMKRSG